MATRTCGLSEVQIESLEKADGSTVKPTHRNAQRKKLATTRAGKGLCEHGNCKVHENIPARWVERIESKIWSCRGQVSE